MELYQLKTFVAVAEEGLLTGAANRLNTSQPAVSAHIKALESEFDLILFDRTPKGMRLTVNGERLFDKARKLLAMADEFSITAATLAEVLSGEVRIGLNSEPKLLRIASILAGFRLHYPDLSINYLQRMSWQAPKEILSGHLDAAFVYGEFSHERLNVLELEKIQLTIVAPSSWKKEVEGCSLSELLNFPWVWVDEECPYHKLALKLFEPTGRVPAKAVIVENEAAINKLVATGAGLSLAPLLSAKKSQETDQLYLLEHPAPTLTLSLIYLKKRANDPVIKAIVDTVQSTWKKDQNLSVEKRLYSEETT